MELTGKCKEIFENWLGSQTRNTGSDIHKWYVTWAKFHIISDSAKWGVYVDFFDSVEDVTENRILSKVSRGFKCYYTELRGNMIVFKTRPEARTAAIDKANEIYNNAH